jgi:flagellar hook-basal body complex protein FliE
MVSNAFYEKHLKSYENSREKYKGTAFGALLDEYIKLINNENKKMTDKVRDFVKKHSKDEQVVFKCPG